MSNENKYKIQVKNLVKEYPGVVALNDVSIDFKSGEVHAIMGENGAGKSTLIKAIAGALIPTSGEIVIDGISYSHLTPHKSRELGVEVIYQEINAFMDLSVKENLFMGSLPGKNGLVDNNKLYKNTEQIFKEMEFHISPNERVGDLTVGYTQMVQIAKAISQDAKVLIMDEPTAPLTNSEIEVLFKIVRTLRQKGLCIIYISHRMNEIFEIADRVTVMRDGQKIDTMNICDTTREELIAKMVGRTLSETFPKRNANVSDEIVLEVKDLVASKVDHVSFNLHKGEILGLAGLVGAGRTETARIIFGADKKESGKILMHGKELNIRSPKDAMNYRIALCPEERKTQGVLINQSIRFNTTLSILKRICKASVINEKQEKNIAANYKETLKIKTPSMEQLVRNLSGGNQQKVVVAKWLATNAEIIIFDEPTRGIDVGVKFEMYQLINKLAEEGKSIIIISSDMEEIIGLCDRIIVLCEGKVSGELKRNEITQERILNFASGN